MNFISTRSNQRQAKFGWEPFATSTPLKTLPNKVDIEKESRKKLQVRTDSVDIIRKLQRSCSVTNVPVDKAGDLKRLESKRPRKNISHLNFDSSSSSDEENSIEKRRPIIKLSFKKQANSFQKSILSDKAVSKVHKSISSCNSSSTCSDIIQKRVEDLKQNFDSLPSSNNKQKQSNTVNSILNDSVSDEDKQIFDLVGSSCNAINNPKIKENKKKHIQGVKCLSNCKSKETKFGNTSQNKQETHSHAEYKSLISKSFQKAKIRNKVSERKCKLIKNTVKSTRSKKVKDQLATPLSKEPKDNALTPIHSVENKTNISHQLFSNTRKQELINILDLTSVEVNEPKESETNHLWKDKTKLLCNSLTSPHPSFYKDSLEHQKENEPKSKLSFEKCHLKNKLEVRLSVPEAKKQFEFEKNLKIFNEKEENIEILKTLKKTKKNMACSSKKADMFAKEFLKNNTEQKDLKQRRTERKTKKNVCCKLNENKETFAFVKAPNSSHEPCNTKTNGESNDLQSTECIPKSQCIKGGETASAGKPVFKLLNELDYKEEEKGCSAVECWNINSFKCGVFKLKIKSQMKCKTVHTSNHLGGVLVKGNLRMKIGDRELDLNPGDMAFVPPLTEWQATNIGKCESVFYYWCGRFKV